MQSPCTCHHYVNAAVVRSRTAHTALRLALLFTLSPPYQDVHKPLGPHVLWGRGGLVYKTGCSDVNPERSKGNWHSCILILLHDGLRARNVRTAFCLKCAKCRRERHMGEMGGEREEVQGQMRATAVQMCPTDTACSVWIRCTKAA